MSTSTNSNIAQINFRPPKLGEELLPRCGDTMLFVFSAKIASSRAQGYRDWESGVQCESRLHHMDVGERRSPL